jgi:hypothetical protein
MPFNRPIKDGKSRPEKPVGLDAVVQAEKMIQIAILLPCSAFIGWLIGAWLDKHLHQTWIGFAGILFGGFSGLFYVVRLALAAEKASDKSGDTDKQA